jgi:tetratricopeptide (TPR) repeat protein
MNNTVSFQRAAGAALFASLCLAQAAGAQAWRGPGRAKGVVLDAAGNPVAGATVTAVWKESEGGGPAPVKTDAKGKWSLIGLTPGDWKLAVAAAGFQPFSDDFAVYPQGSTDTMRAVLTPIPKEVLEADREAQRVEAANSVLGEGNQLAQAGDLPGARAAYEKALEHVEGAKRADVYIAIAGTYINEKKPDQGIEYLKKALEVDPKNESALKLMVSVLTSERRDDEAKQYLAMLPGENSLDAATQVNLGIARYNEGKIEEAGAIFDRVVAQSPDRAEAWYFSALVNLNQQHNDVALERLKKYLDLAKPDDKHVAEAREFVAQLEKTAAAKP